MGVHNLWLNNALTHCCRHTQVKDKDGDKVKEGSKHHGLRGFEHAGGDHGRNRVRSIMKPVHEVEHQRHCHQQNHHPQGGLYGCHEEALLPA